MSDRFYITTPIYYPHAEPHWGAITRRPSRIHWHGITGCAAMRRTSSPAPMSTARRWPQPRPSWASARKELVDRVSNSFREFWKELGISNDDFIRTTDARHKAAVTEVVRKTRCYRRYLPSAATKAGTTKARKNSSPRRRPRRRISSPQSAASRWRGLRNRHIFFRLTKYVLRVIQYIKDNPGFVRPESKRNEVLSKLEAGVDDLSISRATLKWGIQMPNDPEHVVYVWIDAAHQLRQRPRLRHSADDSKFKQFWPADLHLIAKDILWFHTVLLAGDAVRARSAAAEVCVRPRLLDGPRGGR